MNQLDRIKKLKLDYNYYMYIVCHHAVITNYRPIKLQFPLFLATVLTNELVILTILFLQCEYNIPLKEIQSRNDWNIKTSKDP